MDTSTNGTADPSTDMNLFNASQAFVYDAARAYLKHASNLDALNLQVIANSGISNNIVNKQSIQHRDIAVDAQWYDSMSPEERGAAAAISGTPGVAADAVAAGIPANLDAQVVAAWLANPANAAALSQLIQNAKQAATPAA